MLRIEKLMKRNLISVRSDEIRGRVEVFVRQELGPFFRDRGKEGRADTQVRPY